MYTSLLARFELTTLVVIGTDCISSCKSNDHTITTTTTLQRILLPSCSCVYEVYLVLLSYNNMKIKTSCSCCKIFLIYLLNFNMVIEAWGIISMLCFLVITIDIPLQTYPFYDCFPIKQRKKNSARINYLMFFITKLNNNLYWT